MNKRNDESGDLAADGSSGGGDKGRRGENVYEVNLDKDSDGTSGRRGSGGKDSDGGGGGVSVETQEQVNASGVVSVETQEQVNASGGVSVETQEQVNASGGVRRSSVSVEIIEQVNASGGDQRIQPTSTGSDLAIVIQDIPLIPEKHGCHWIGTSTYYVAVLNAIKVLIMAMLLATAVMDILHKGLYLFPTIMGLALIIGSSSLSFLSAIELFYSQGIRFLSFLGFYTSLDVLASFMHCCMGFTCLGFAIAKKNLPLWLDILLFFNVAVTGLFVILWALDAVMAFPHSRTSPGQFRRFILQLNEIFIAFNKLTAEFDHTVAKVNKNANKWTEKQRKLVEMEEKRQVMFNRAMELRDIMAREGPATATATAPAPAPATVPA